MPSTKQGILALAALHINAYQWRLGFCSLAAPTIDTTDLDYYANEITSQGSRPLLSFDPLLITWKPLTLQAEAQIESTVTGAADYSVTTTFVMAAPSVSAAPQILISTISPANNTITFGAAHGFAENDRVMIRTISGATAPGGTTADTFYYVGVTNSTTITLKDGVSGNVIDITNGGAGTLAIRYCQATVMLYQVLSPVANIQTGSTSLFRLNQLWGRIV